MSTKSTRKGKAEAATRNLIGNYSPKSIERAKNYFLAATSLYTEEVDSVPPYITALIEKEVEIKLFYDSSHNVEERAIASVAQYLELHPNE